MTTQRQPQTVPEPIALGDRDAEPSSDDEDWASWFAEHYADPDDWESQAWLDAFRRRA